MPRGGDQVIPRPVAARPGAPAPWADLAASGSLPRLDVAHLRRTMAGAPEPVRSELLGTGARASAVLAPLYDDAAGALVVILTRRAAHLRSHRNEVSFPGGGHEPDDPDLMSTALRESEEETGLDSALVEVLGELDHRATITSRSFIVPYVSAIPSGRPVLAPNPGEVARILHVPVAELLEPGVYREERWGLPTGDHPIHFFEIEGDTIWGATAAMLVNLCCLLTGTRPEG